MQTAAHVRKPLPAIGAKVCWYGIVKDWRLGEFIRLDPETATEENPLCEVLASNGQCLVRLSELF